MRVESLLTSDEATATARSFAEAKRLFSEEDFAAAKKIANRLDGDLRQRARALAAERRPPLASVVVVTYGDRPDYAEALRRLAASTVRNDCEFILVDNGSERARAIWAEIFPDERILDVGFNFGCSGGRNLGAEIAAGDIVVFIDDDGLVTPDCVERLVAALDENNAVAVRGRVLPKAPGNAVSSSYDLGLYPRPAPMTAEGVSAFRREPFLAADGFDPLLAGHEGALLSTRLYRIHGPASLIYEPGGVLFHDYATSTDVAGAKKIAQDRNLSYISQSEPAYGAILTALRSASHKDMSVQYFVERDEYAALTRTTPEGAPGDMVSIITTAHNARAFLLGFHASLARQTTQQFEIVFVDDGSTDGTADEVARIFGDDLRLKLIRSPRVGRAEALNIAMRAASHDICLIADVDDVSLPYRFQASREILAADVALDCISFPMFDDRTTYLLGRPHQPQIRDFGVRALFGMPAPFPSFAFRKSRFHEPFDPKVTGGIDYDWLARNMLTHDVQGKIIPIHGTYYRRHDGQISTTKRDQQQITAIRWLTAFHHRLLPAMTAEDERLAAALSGWISPQPNDVPALRAYIFRLVSAATAIGPEVSRAIATAMFARMAEIELALAKSLASTKPKSAASRKSAPGRRTETPAKAQAKAPPNLVDGWPEPPWPVLRRFVSKKLKRRLKSPLGVRPEDRQGTTIPPQIAEATAVAGKWPEPPWPVLLKMLAMKAGRRLQMVPRRT